MKKNLEQITHNDNNKKSYSLFISHFLIPRNLTQNFSRKGFAFPTLLFFLYLDNFIYVIFSTKSFSPSPSSLFLSHTIIYLLACLLIQVRSLQLLFFMYTTMINSRVMFAHITFRIYVRMCVEV